MLEFGLTGGIGSGKSTVSEMFAAKGARIVDADAIVRELQEPGQPVLEQMVERWGDQILDAQGRLLRPRVAEIVFDDKDELKALNGIVHPAVGKRTAEIMAEAAADKGTDVMSIVVHDVPLLITPAGTTLTNRKIEDWAGIIVVDTPLDVAVERVLGSRDMTEAQVRDRIAAQATREQRRDGADWVIDNGLDLEHLQSQVDGCWAWMTAGGRTIDREVS